MFRSRGVTRDRTTEARVRLHLEPLEQRLLLDGNVLVNVVGNDVFIFGDDLSNDITVGMTATDLVVTPNGTTTVNGGAAPISIARPVLNLTMVMNAGDDVVLVDNVAIGGSLDFDGDGGSDSLVVVDSGIGGSVDFAGALGADVFQLVNSGVAGSVTANMGRNVDLVNIADSGIGGQIAAMSSHGQLDFAMANTGIRGDVALHGGDGRLDPSIGSSGIGGALSATTNGIMLFDFVSGGVREGINVMAGNTDLSLFISEAGIGGDINIATRNALPGAMPELELTIDDVGLRGNLSVAAGTGFAGDMLLRDVRARGSVETTWQDLDGLSGSTRVETVVAGGGVSVAGSKGLFEVLMFQVASGASIDVHGNFLTDLDAQTLIARRDINVMFGPGRLEMDLNDAVAGRHMNVAGAGGIEEMQIIGAQVRGNVNVDTGDGSAASILANSFVGGALNVTNGAGLLADYQIFQTVVRGDLNVNSSALSTMLDLVVAVGGNVDVQTGLGADDIFMEDSGVRGRTTIRSGGGNDDIGLANSLLNGNVLVESGSGLDEVSLAGAFADEFGRALTFNSGVTVRLGADNDFMEIGALGGTGETAVFNGSVLFDGGPGAGDVADFDPVNTFTQAPSVINFELIV